MSTLSVASLKKQLALELSCLASEDTSGGTSSVPIMESLRSPTTRTLFCILNNTNHFVSIQTEFEAAKREEEACQELIDDAEKLRAEPLSKSFTDSIKAVVNSLDNPLLEASKKKRAPIGKFTPPPSTTDPEMDRIGIRCVSVKEDGIPATAFDEANLDIVSSVQFSMPRNDAGTMIGMSAAKSLILPGPEEQKKRQKTRAEVQVETDWKNIGMPVHCDTGYAAEAGPSGRERMMALLNEQKEMKVKHEEGQKGYADLLAGFTKWQADRRRVFDVILKTDE